MSTSPAGIEAQIRQAYKKLAITSEWVPLRNLRAALNLDRDDVDQALTAMQAKAEALLIPEENQKTLTPADRDAAIYFGGQARHLILIEHH